MGDLVRVNLLCYLFNRDLANGQCLLSDVDRVQRLFIFVCLLGLLYLLKLRILEVVLEISSLVGLRHGQVPEIDGGIFGFFLTFVLIGCGVAALSIALALVPLLHLKVLLDAAFPLRRGILPAFWLLSLVNLLSLTVNVRAVGSVRNHHGAMVTLMSSTCLRILLREFCVFGVSSACATI